MAKKSTASNSTNQNEPETPSLESKKGNGKYTVVARRYRPKTFAELVGQSTVAQALLNAINSNRVGHAYLFTGARGVGKTSTARIFAKALNASAETDGQFDPNSDIAQAIDAGEDMDVLEIDGASNRGIDEIRQLRANAAVRPSRSRYKIYIIDEVHMLTTQAFNALLKTLEEPPGHVKFIFCTTDPEKLPITVLSRCQRFDFPPVHTEQIYERLKFICQNEGTKADEAALRLIARRAAGSMRDSQSLLEQLLSFGGDEITADVVHSMLGTADETRLAAFASRLIERDAAGALRELDNASSEGVDVGQLAEQLMGYLRDMMTVSVGGGEDLIRTANSNSADQMRQWGETWGTMTLLAALQLLDETIVKMRYSVQSRVLLEVALVQICNLQDLQSLSELVKAFASSQPAPLPRVAISTIDAKKKVEVEPVVPSAMKPVAASTQLEVATISGTSAAAIHAIETETEPNDPVTQPLGPEPEARAQAAEPILNETISLPDDNLTAFREIATKLGGFAEQCAAMAVRVEDHSDTQWRICLSRDGSMVRDYFLTADNSKRLTQAVKEKIGHSKLLAFVVTDEPTPVLEAREHVDVQPMEAEKRPELVAPSIPQSQLIRNAMGNPLVKQFMDVFDGQIVRVDPVRIQLPALHFDLAGKTAPETAQLE